MRVGEEHREGPAYRPLAEPRVRRLRSVPRWGPFEEDRAGPWWAFGDERSERLDEAGGGTRLAARELAVRSEHESGCWCSTGESLRLEASEVGDVLRDERTVLGEREGQELLIRSAFEPAVVRVVDGDDVMATRA